MSHGTENALQLYATVDSLRNNGEYCYEGSQKAARERREKKSFHDHLNARIFAKNHCIVVERYIWHNCRTEQSVIVNYYRSSCNHCAPRQ